MFGILKKKLGDVIKRFTDSAEPTPEQARESAPEPARAKAEPPKPTEKEKEEKPQPVPIPKVKEPVIQPETSKAAPEHHIETAPPEKKGLFKRITSAFTEPLTTTKISEEKFEQLFNELEVTLLENNAAVEVIDKIKGDLKGTLVEKQLARGKVEDTIRKTLSSSIEGLFANSYDFTRKAKEEAAAKKPFKIVFVGINGSGKTTTIAKIANLLQEQKLSVVMAAADTFRAAAIHQLQEHADKLGVKLIKHDYGSDPAAVAFDAVKYAEAHNIDVVLIDTAGRLHSNINLIDEMKKITRVAKPDLKIFVGESITGNDCVEQARTFNDAIGIDGIILSKADVDEKGGAAISVSYITKKPILFIGTGQGYGDLKPFSAEMVTKQLGLA